MYDLCGVVARYQRLYDKESSERYNDKLVVSYFTNLD